MNWLTIVGSENGGLHPIQNMSSCSALMPILKELPLVHLSSLLLYFERTNCLLDDTKFHFFITGK